LLTYVVPSYLLMKEFTSYEGRVMGISMPLLTRMKLQTRLFDKEAYENVSVHRRFILVDNIVTEDSVHCRISGWTCSTVPSRILRLPRSVALDVVRDTFESYPLFAVRLKRVFFWYEGHEAGVFSVRQ